MTLYYRCNQPRLERKGFCCCRIVMGYNMSVHMHKFIRKDNIVRKNPQNSWFELTRYIGSSIYVNRTKGTLTSTSIKSFTTMPPVCKPSLDLTPMMVPYNVKHSPYSSWMSVMAISIRQCTFFLANSLPHS